MSAPLSERIRDPRVNPKVGDRFSKGECVATISHVSSGGYSFQCCGKLVDAPPMTWWGEPWLPEFRKWAKDAEVIHAAD